jgi:hypothetical protein
MGVDEEGYTERLCGLPLDEVFALIYRLLHFRWREFGNRERLGSFDHYHCKFEWQIRILPLFGVGMVELQSSSVKERATYLPGHRWECLRVGPGVGDWGRTHLMGKSGEGPVSGAGGL